MGGISWYSAALLMGFAGSLHCIGMCGPIFIASSGFYASPQEFAKPLFIHQGSKVLSYCVLGLAMGLLGKGVSLLWFQNQIMLGSGLLLLLMGFGAMVQWKFLAPVQAWTSKKMGELLQRKNRGHFLLGLVNGLLPCGLVYAAAIAAVATDSIGKSVLFMAFFGLGTLPALTLTGFSRWFMPKIRVKNLAIWKQIPVILLGLWLLLHGLGLGIPYLSPNLKSHEPTQNCCSRHHK